jgi:hypothetical protein
VSHLFWRIDRALAQIAQVNSDRGRMVRRIYLDKDDLAELKSLRHGYEYHGFEIAKTPAPKSRIFNKCGQGFAIVKVKA